MGPHGDVQIVLDTTGTSDLSAVEVIVHAILHHEGFVDVYVPIGAMDVACLIALAGDALHLAEPCAFLCPMVGSRHDLTRVHTLLKQCYPPRDPSDEPDEHESTSLEVNDYLANATNMLITR